MFHVKHRGSGVREEHGWRANLSDCHQPRDCGSGRERSVFSERAFEFCVHSAEFPVDRGEARLSGSHDALLGVVDEQDLARVYAKASCNDEEELRIGFRDTKLMRGEERIDLISIATRVPHAVGSVVILVGADVHAEACYAHARDETRCRD